MRLNLENNKAGTLLPALDSNFGYLVSTQGFTDIITDEPPNIISGISYEEENVGRTDWGMMIPKRELFGSIKSYMFKAVPVFGLAASILTTNVCLANHQEDVGTNYRSVDNITFNMNQSTWTEYLDEYMYKGAQLFSSTEISDDYFLPLRKDIEETVDYLDAQPSFNYLEVVGYAESMGLRTDFPL